jgi:hypothetical protein
MDSALFHAENRFLYLSLHPNTLTQLLSSEDISLVACAITALPWCSHNHLLPSRFARCLRLTCLIEELSVRCGLFSALTATLMTDPTVGIRPASIISAALGSSQTLDILQVFNFLFYCIIFFPPPPFFFSQKNSGSFYINCRSQIVF